MQASILSYYDVVTLARRAVDFLGNWVISVLVTSMKTTSKADWSREKATLLLSYFREIGSFMRQPHTGI